MSTGVGETTVSTQPLNVRYSLDAGIGRYRIGLIALDTDQTTERDFRNMSPGDEVAVFVSRVHNVNPITIENLRLMGPQITQATSLLLPDARLDAIAYSCTSGTVAIGFDGIRSSIQAAHPGATCTTPITAALAGFRALVIERIALLTPYVDRVNQAMRAYLEANGISVLSISSFNLESDLDMARVPPDAIFEAGLEADHADADALFISCTALRAAEVVDPLEQKLGKPVLSAIQAMFWDALRIAGCNDPVSGYGRLLRVQNLTAPPPGMTIYGLRGVTHGTAKVLTVMSPQGASAALEHIEANDDVITYAGPGRLTQYHEKRSGTLERLIAVNGIKVLSKAQWDAKKAEFGDVIWA